MTCHEEHGTVGVVAVEIELQDRLDLVLVVLELVVRGQQETPTVTVVGLLIDQMDELGDQEVVDEGGHVGGVVCEVELSQLWGETLKLTRLEVTTLETREEGEKVFAQAHVLTNRDLMI